MVESMPAKRHGTRRRAARPGAEPTTKIYLRCSRDEQAISGHSPENQENAIREFAKYRQINISRAEWYRDIGESAYTKRLADRSEGRKLSLSLKDGDIVVAATLDRLFRNTADGIACMREWDEREIRLVICHMGGGFVDTSSCVGKLLLTTMMSFAEFESGIRGERRRQHNNRLREQNGGKLPPRTITRAPLGYMFKEFQNSKKLVVVRDEYMGRIIDRIRREHKEGKTYSEIANKLNTETMFALRYKRKASYLSAREKSWVQHHYIDKWYVNLVYTAVHGQKMRPEIIGYAEPVTENATSYENRDQTVALPPGLYEWKTWFKRSGN
jgi:DNA invertase Pin-like site-specific DNA recombinase